MGSGKSTATAYLEELGYRRVDSDQIVRDEVLHEAEVIAALAARFGPQVLSPAGQVDRRAVAAIVFNSDAEREWLEELVHPRLYVRWRAAFAADRYHPWVVEVPLLFEKALENWFDFTVCVASSSDLQLARLEKRGTPHALAEQRISKQLPLALKLELSDFVLWNDGSRDFLREQIVHLHHQLTARPTGR
jgi:dephospho-CoA kinase